MANDPSQAAGQTAQQIKDTAAEMGQRARDTAGQAMDKGRRTAQRVGESLKSGMDTSLDQVQHFVDQRPLTSLMIVFGLGVLLGGLVSRR